MTHTFATLEVSAAAYDEIMLKLRDAGYEHAILSWAADHGRKDVIDMHGIGLVRADPLESIKKLACAGEPLIDINAVRKTSTPE